jgi:hypothetical protein
MKKTLFFLLVLFFVLACVVQPFSVPDFPYDPMLQSADLPAGFERVNGEFPHVSGGFSHLVAYSDEPGVVGIGISHQLTIYPDIDSAKDSFTNWDKEWFTNSWTTPSIIYTPLDNTDQYELKCMDVQINTYLAQSCTFLQQHNNMIILVLANIDDTSINWDQFIEALQKLDERLPAHGEIVPLPSE